MRSFSYHKIKKLRLTCHFVLAVECDIRDVNLNERYLMSRVEGNKLGQVVYFNCALGFKLNGTANLTCQASGNFVYIYLQYTLTNPLPLFS